MTGVSQTKPSDWHAVGHSSDEEDWEIVSAPLADYDIVSDPGDAEPEVEPNESSVDETSENEECSKDSEGDQEPEPVEDKCPRYYPIEPSTSPASYCAHIFTLFSVSVVLCQTLERVATPAANPAIHPISAPGLRHSYVVHGTVPGGDAIVRPSYDQLPQDFHASLSDNDFPWGGPLIANVTNYEIESASEPLKFETTSSYINNEVSVPVSVEEAASLTIKIEPFSPSVVETTPTDIVIKYDPASPPHLLTRPEEPRKPLYNAAEAQKPICFDDCFSPCEDQCELDCLGSSMDAQDSTFRPRLNDERTQFCMSSCKQSCLPTCRGSCAQIGPNTSTVVALNNAACGSQCRALCTWSAESCAALCDGWCEN